MAGRKGRGHECLQRATVISFGQKYLLLNVVRKSDTRTSFRSHLRVAAVLFLWTSKKFHVKKVTLLVMLITFLLKLIHKAGVWPTPPEKANVKGDLTNVKRFNSISVIMIAVWCCLFHTGDIHKIDSRGTENKKKRGCYVGKTKENSYNYSFSWDCPGEEMR